MAARSATFVGLLERTPRLSYQSEICSAVSALCPSTGVGADAAVPATPNANASAATRPTVHRSAPRLDRRPATLASMSARPSKRRENRRARPPAPSARVAPFPAGPRARPLVRRRAPHPSRLQVAHRVPARSGGARGGRVRHDLVRRATGEGACPTSRSWSARSPRRGASRRTSGTSGRGSSPTGSRAGGCPPPHRGRPAIRGPWGRLSPGGGGPRRRAHPRALGAARMPVRACVHRSSSRIRGPRRLTVAVSAPRRRALVPRSTSRSPLSRPWPRRRRRPRPSRSARGRSCRRPPASAART